MRDSPKMDVQYGLYTNGYESKHFVIPNQMFSKFAKSV